ncbi:MAG: 3-dehydroquinate synthase [Deltaproteobacteria bacterium]|nr:3-dehydroquinate synthase [Deltaproteobacteria bacterium]MBW2309032.1 3-dehydroquinate synthase [Deltaproteobacteria bacterium]
MPGQLHEHTPVRGDKCAIWTDRLAVRFKNRRPIGIHVGHHVLGELGSLLRDAGAGASRIGAVTNTVVAHHYLPPVIKGLERAGYTACPIIIPDGEAEKNLERVGWLCGEWLGAGLDRSSMVVALGGGVIGDLAGFAAATYLRGIGFVQVPTTLLAMVDAAIGGKTAVNHPMAKNIIGAFHQPLLVLEDLATLETLPERQWRDGLAEVVKTAIILDADLFLYLEQNAEDILRRRPESVRHIVVTCAGHKARIVAEDETESGLRALLNYGHTLGHCIEALTGYEEWSHGEAVSAGMAAAARLARLLGLCGKEEAERQRALLESFGLPTRLPRLDPEALMRTLYHDKKTRDGKLRFVLSPAIGQARMLEGVEEDLIRKVLAGQ